MQIELTQAIALNLVLGTNGPGDYSDKFNNVGELRGFPNERWEWKHEVLNKMTLEQLYNLYLEITKHKDASSNT